MPLLLHIAMPIMPQEVSYMTTDELINHFGTQQKAAKAIGISQPSVAGWIKAGSIPLPRQYQIQVITGGALQADQKAA